MLEGLVQGLFENLAELLPVKVVRSYERGVKWTLGRNPTQLDPGPHLRVWFYHSIETAIVADDTIELPTQSIITKDEKLVVFKAIIGFKIEDVVKHFTNVTDFRESTTGLAMTHLAKRVRDLTLAELVGDLGKLEKSLSTTLTTKFKEWGTVVNYVGFSDFAEVPTQIRIFGEGAPFVRTV
jgi:regulator of protease activity HflC (stomatin/prohibitin superfamily)